MAADQEPETNIRRLNPSRKAPKPGDIFVMQIPDRSFLFGRVITPDARWAVGEGSGAAVLIYVYDTPQQSKALADPAALSPDRLLLPPILTNRLPWARGYFETVANVELREQDVLAPNTFYSAFRDKFYDERAHELEQPGRLVGTLGLDSYRTIDDKISGALGIPLAGH